MNITIVGTGYVGLVTATCLAETGNYVWCIDTDLGKIEMMKSGKIPIYEPHLTNIFERNIKAGRLSFTSDLKVAFEKSTVIFLCLPTPPDEDGSADLSHVLGVADRIGTMIRSYKVIVNKSTVPAGTNQKVTEKISQHTTVPFDVVSNPEFLREGFAVEDFMKPSRIVVGSHSKRAIQLMTDLYRPYVRSGDPIIVMDPKSAEITKYAANAFLATKISFMNEMANFCEKAGADVEKVRLGMGSDDRIGSKFLFPGIGYGGSCFPKDVTALDKSGTEYGYHFDIVKSVNRVNDAQKEVLFAKIKSYFGDGLKSKKIALWGLAFKPDTDDIREAPAIRLIENLLQENVSVQAFDPEASENMKNLFGDKITYVQKQYEALENADALVICTEWNQFRNPNFDTIKEHLSKPTVVFDGRNLFEPKDMKSRRIQYFCIGRSQTG